MKKNALWHPAVGYRPVPKKTRVEVMFADGDKLTGEAKEFYWTPKEIADTFGKKFKQGNLVVAWRRVLPLDIRPVTV